MRELERDPPDHAAPDAPASPVRRLALVGAGRAGRAFADAAGHAGIEAVLTGRDDRGPAVRRADAVLLCVPDAAIADACERLVERDALPALVGHVSGASGLDALAAAHSRGAAVFSLHPLQTLPAAGGDLRGAHCAVAGSDERTRRAAAELGRTLGMSVFDVPDSSRGAYHAAASMASNFLVALEEAAAGLLTGAGIDDARRLLGPLVLRAAANWADQGPEALTGPIARGDEATVARHREAISRVAPQLLETYDALAATTRRLAGTARPDAAAAGRPHLCRSKAELHDALASARRTGAAIGLVPTMGFLHEGHASLLRAARERCETVVMSSFVNPAQFGPSEDLDSYPRDEASDLGLAARCGVDVVYAPAVDEVYPDGFATTVEVDERLTGVLCGSPEHRGQRHFNGVTTVVAKLFATVAPDVAFFGQKDAQQAIVIRRMVRDLDLAVEISVEPTVRESDGLAMSSRNAYLSEEDRRRAPALYRALSAAEGAAATGAGLDTALEAARSVLAEAGIEPEYLEARDAEDLSKAASFEGRPVLLAVAARLGTARLIDNVVIGAR